MPTTSISGIERDTLDRFNKNKDIFEKQGTSVNADGFLNYLLSGYELGRQAEAQLVESSSTGGQSQ